jgi:TPR repeat protein
VQGLHCLGEFETNHGAGHAAARPFYEAAAELGHWPATKHLAVVASERRLALLERAAAQGHAEAHYHLARLFEKARDSAKRLEHLRKGAALGHNPCQELLAGLGLGPASAAVPAAASLKLA